MCVDHLSRFLQWRFCFARILQAIDVAPVCCVCTPRAVGVGILKVMAKMGISTVASYKGAQIFEVRVTL